MAAGPVSYQFTPNLLQVQAMRECCRAAAMYHDSPACKGYSCLPWAFCTCERAKAIREADVAILRLEASIREGEVL